MYLTRMPLDVSLRSTMLALSAPNLFHGAVEQSFPGERRRNLWRVDRLNGQYFLLILSKDKPDLSRAARQFAPADATWETKDYEPFLSRVRSESAWRFRLCANPTYSVSEKPGENWARGKVCAHTTTAHQRAWLVKQAARHGFELRDDGFDVVGSQWHRFRKGAGAEVSLLAVTYEGELRVTDEAAFREMLISGVGREKAYGVGLMTLARISGAVNA